ncbi:phosphatase activator activity protein [[Candida] boidinii]|nr:phosphatase activator activity protein [[Candida] boidinii]
MSQNIITQVSQNEGVAMMPQQEMDDYNTEIRMNLRGQYFTITRDDLMALPESILLCLFPNGVFVDIDGNVITNLTEEDIVYVNFAPECFQYICDIFDAAVHDLQMNEKANLYGQQQVNHQQVYDVHDPNILSDKPSIIVLREDLDYYCIPPVNGLNADQMRHIKILVGLEIVKNSKIFNGLGYSPDKQLKPAEQHLLDMLCSSGFEIDGDWGHRSAEPGKTVVFSLALVRLKTEEPTPKESPNLEPVVSANSATSRRSRLRDFAHNVSRSASRSKKDKISNSTATKLLLFWRKPARKCWWSDDLVNVDLTYMGLKDENGSPLTTVTIKVHTRRVWTLELSVVGVQ